ncbi:hypothetical protein EVAR_51425_1 [Eumeta japonica]|uniref:Uncharacterized protein n=1 Tax=Eumeta variegata TaxID=151549 RepID=A0A4C1XXH1_EUMVA|nr:hypothetical protein EVAR_51425_1 [Eumeta japonica]
MSRARKAAFLLLSIREYRRKLPAIRGCRNLLLALLDHCPDVVGKSTYGKSISSVDAIGNAVEVWSVDFLKRGRHSFPISNFADGNRPPAVGRWAAPSYVLQLKSPKRMTASPKAKRLLGCARATVLETEIA